jgi:inner membrane protein YidH
MARARLSASRKRGADMSEQRGPEVQFQLANERTYLAWLRTALALVASGVAAARLLAGQSLHWAWETVGVLLILAGVVTAANARRRWRAMEAAVRAGEPLPAPGVAVVIAGVIVLCGLITIALLLGTDPGHVP